MSFKNLFRVITFAGMFVLPMTAFAYPLSISNLTKSTMSVKVSGQCSSSYGNIAAMNSAVVDTSALAGVCGGAASNCFVQLYNAASCSGSEIANFYFNYKTRTTGVGGAGAPYTIRIEPHRVTVVQH